MDREKLLTAHTRLVELAAGDHEYIPGHSLGKKPKFFILGDEPVQADYVTKVPFSGPLTDVLVAAIRSLRPKYPGAKREDCHITYVVKSTFEEGELSEKDVLDKWLPALQLEYYLSGCELVVAVGRMSRVLAGQVAVRPPMLDNYKPTIIERVKTAWKVLRG